VIGEVALMQFIRHVVCGNEVFTRRGPGDADCPVGYLGLWCPACVKFVEKQETNASGALAVVFEKAAKETQ
jgi:hypothetical protein